MKNEREFKISNQIITIDKIIEVSDYMQKIVRHYNDLIDEDKRKNENAYLDNANYNYYAFSKCKVEYTIDFLDGRGIKTEDEYTFKEELKEPKFIKSIALYLYVAYIDNNLNERTDHSISLYLSLWNDNVNMNASSSYMDDEMYNLHSYIKGIFEKGEERNSKIVKNRNFVKMLFSLAVGSILSYIPILILFLLNSSENIGVNMIFSNGIIFVILQWFIIFSIGKFLGYPIMNNLYNKIEPQKTIGNAEYQAKKLEEFISGNEILIGDRVNNLEKRAIITKYYELSKKVVLGQVIISLILIVVFYLLFK